MILCHVHLVQARRDSVKCSAAGRSHNANAAAAQPILRHLAPSPQHSPDEGQRDGLERVFNMATTGVSGMSDHEHRQADTGTAASSGVHLSDILQEAEALTQSFEALQAKREPSRKDRGRARAVNR